MTKIVETQCRVCKKPMHVEADTSQFQYEVFFKMITCDDCLAAKGLGPKRKAVQPEIFNQHNDP